MPHAFFSLFVRLQCINDFSQNKFIEINLVQILLVYKQYITVKAYYTDNFIYL